LQDQHNPTAAQDYLHNGAFTYEKPMAKNHGTYGPTSSNEIVSLQTV